MSADDVAPLGEGDHGSAQPRSIAEIARDVRRAMRDGDIDVESRLRDQAMQYHLDNGDGGRAIEHAARLVDISTADEGVDGDNTMVWRGFLGRAYTEARFYPEGEAILRDLVADRQRVLGPDHPLTLVARGNLVRAIGRGGRPHEALPLADELLADRLRLLGPDHPSTLDSRGHVAQLYDLVGDPATALRMMRSLLADRERVLDPDDPVLLSTRHNVAAMAASADGTLDGLPGLDANVAAMTERLGADHPDTLLARVFMGIWLDPSTSAPELRQRLLGLNRP